MDERGLAGFLVHKIEKGLKEGFQKRGLKREV